MSKILLLPGMTREYPVYSRLLPMLPSASVIDFIEPLKSESLENYAARMAESVPNDCFIGGVSFGGIVAHEIAKLVRPKGCILIASIRSPAELPGRFRMLRGARVGSYQRAFRLVGFTSSLLSRITRLPAAHRLAKLAGEEGSWHRWATAAVLNWKPDSALSEGLRILHIHGDKDTTFPIRHINPDVIITEGVHALPVSHPEAVRIAIQEFTEAAT